MTMKPFRFPEFCFYAVTLCAGLALAAGCTSVDRDFEALVALGEPVDLLIEGGTIIDGSGGVGYRGDLLVKGDRIAFVGDVDPSRIDIRRTIDATGLVVTPGFIDPHSHGNPVDAPELRNFAAMGVTTITIGQDGSSPRTADLGAWLQKADSAGPGVNVAVFAGHGTLRHLSGIGNDENPTEAQIDSMTALLARQLAAGAFGLSTGLEYTPGAYSGESELIAMARVAGMAGGTVMSHIRNEDDDVVEDAIRELLRQGNPAAVHVSHIKSVYGKGAARAEEILAVLDSARASGTAITADMYPYTASYTGIGIVFPLWAKAPNDFSQVVNSRREELAAYLRERVSLRNGPDATLIGSGRFAGLTLAEVADKLEKPFEDVLIDDIGPDGASGAYFVMDDELQERLAQDPYVMFSSDGSATGFHPRGHGTFAKIVEEFVIAKKLLSLEEAVRKMTSLPASVIGLNDRGLLEAGQFADVLIFDPAAVRARATYAEPHQLSEGFNWAIVNGELIVDDGRFTDVAAGRVLRRSRN